MAAGAWQVLTMQHRSICYNIFPTNKLAALEHVSSIWKQGQTKEALSFALHLFIWFSFSAGNSSGVSHLQQHADPEWPHER